MNQEQVNSLMQAMTNSGLTQAEAAQVAQSLINQNATFEQSVAAIQQLLASRAAPNVVAQPNVIAQPAQANVVQTSVGINNLLAIATLAGESDDHGLIRAGFAPAEEGFCTMRLKGYIEIGVHAPSNVKHKNREMVYVIMEVNTANHLITEDGVQKPREIVIRTPKAHSNNAGFPRLFAALNACHGNKYHHIGEMLGAAFCGKIYHSEPDGNGRVWENFDKDKVWSFAAPQGKNIDGTPYSINVPELVEAPMMFVFDNPSITDPNAVKQMWDSIYIAGVRTSEKNGAQVETSKNYYQETIRASLTWNTSKTKQMLSSMCAPETLTPIAPKKAPAGAAAGATTTPALGATIQPATIQPTIQPTVQPVVQSTPAVQPVVQPQVSVQPESVQPVNVQPAQLTVPDMTVQPQVELSAAQPTVVNVSPEFVAPLTQQQQVAAQPTVAQPQVTVQPAAAGSDVNAWLAQLAK